jgi:hypothetical protein
VSAVNVRVQRCARDSGKVLSDSYIRCFGREQEVYIARKIRVIEIFLESHLQTFLGLIFAVPHIGIADHSV